MMALEPTGMTIRAGDISDLAALVEIYNHYVTETVVTFDTEPFDVEQRRHWFAQFAPASRHQVFVAKRDGVILGYATSQPLKQKQAYETSVETSIYLKPDAGGMGIGTALYSALFAALAECDVHRAYGLISLPNDASIALHLKHGFAPCSIFREIGRKFGHYHDIQWFERHVP